MKKIKNVIIILIFLIVISLISIIILNTIPKYKNDADGDIGDEPEITGNIENVTDITTLVTIENCIEQYYNAINNNSSIYYIRGEEGYKKIVTDEEMNQEILKLLSDEYITKKNINTSNLDKYVKKINEEVNVISLKMTALINNPIEKYFVYGKAVNAEYELIDEFYMYVNLDVVNKTFSIEPINNSDFNENEITNNNVSIEVKDNNTYESADLGYEEIIEDRMKKFKILAFTDIESSYNYLDEEYRNKKFSNINKYVEYIELNREDIVESSIKKYKVNYYDDYTEYICIDQYGNYYIFDEKDIMNYTVKLDTYTIDEEEFDNKYNNGSNQLKVGMNLEKVFQALNRKDYEYIYGKLDDNFKQNNFPTLSDFERYVKNTFYDINKIEYGNCKEQSGMYIYSITVFDATEYVESYDDTNEDDSEEDIEENEQDSEINQNKVEKDFIVKLDEGTEFKIAFNIN